MSSHCEYIYFEKIDTDSDGRFTVNLQNIHSTKANELLALPKNQQYFATNLRVSTVLQEGEV